ncbi:MAG: phage holin family protein [Ginsengibacter sp.]
MSIIIRLLITAAVAYGLSLILSPHIRIDGFGTAILFVLLLGILNAIVKPLLVILTLPITILTLGLFLLVLNVLMILLADYLMDGIHIDGFLWAFIFGLLLSALSSLLSGGDKR